MSCHYLAIIMMIQLSDGWSQMKSLSTTSMLPSEKNTNVMMSHLLHKFTVGAKKLCQLWILSSFYLSPFNYLYDAGKSQKWRPGWIPATGRRSFSALQTKLSSYKLSLASTFVLQTWSCFIVKSIQNFQLFQWGPQQFPAMAGRQEERCRGVQCLPDPVF